MSPPAKLTTRFTSQSARVSLSSKSADSYCFTVGGSATVDPDFANQSQIVVTRVDGLASGTSSAARVGARTASGAH